MTLEIRSAGEGGQEQHDDDNGVAEIRAAVETFTTTADGRFTSIDTGLTELRGRLDRVETTLRRPGLLAGGNGGGTATDPRQIEQRAFLNYVRRGREAMEADELRALRVSDDTAGGYLVPEQFIGELMRNVVLFSPVRSVARVATMSASVAVLPKRTAGMTGQWVGETGARPETTVTFGQVRYPSCEFACFVDATNQMLEDGQFDIGALLSFEFGQEFGHAEAKAFVNGDGVLEPEGFMQNAAIDYTASGDASKITADAIIQLYHDIPSPYRGSAVWMMNSSTMAAIRKLKDGTGNYLIQVAGLAGAPATTLLGRPIVEAPDMPDIAANAFPIVFGDFGAGYRVFDRVSLSVLRDPYSQATNGNVRFHGRRRVAGGVGLAEALRKMKVATS